MDATEIRFVKNMVAEGISWRTIQKVTCRSSSTRPVANLGVLDANLVVLATNPGKLRGMPRIIQAQKSLELIESPSDFLYVCYMRGPPCNLDAD